MKTALVSIAALAAVYFFIILPDSRSKKEAARRREEDAAKIAEMEKANEETEKAIKSQQVRDREFREALKSKVNQPVVAKGPPVLAPLPPEAETQAEEAKPKTGDAKPAEPEPAPPPAASGEVSFQKYADRLFIVKGDRGAGSGFICELNGKAVCVTNSHVLSGNKTLSFTRPDGKPMEVAVDQMQVSTDRDLALFPLKTVLPALKIPDAKTKIDIGDEVICLGNSGGGGVVTDVRGTVLGVGPAEIEVDAPFVEGNSGSPIMHLKSDTVIGIATRSARERVTVTKLDTRFAEVRRYGTRIEGTSWKVYKWADFAAEATLIQSYIKHSEQLAALMLELMAGSLNPNSYDDTSVGIRAAVRAYIAAATSKGLTQADRLRAQAAFLRDVGFEIRKGPFEELSVMRTKADAMCAYHKEVMTGQIKMREELSEKMKELAGAKIDIASSAQTPGGAGRRPTPVRPGPVPISPATR